MKCVYQHEVCTTMMCVCHHDVCTTMMCVYHHEVCTTMKCTTMMCVYHHEACTTNNKELTQRVGMSVLIKMLEVTDGRLQPLHQLTTKKHKQQTSEWII